MPGFACRCSRLYSHAEDEHAAAVRHPAIMHFPHSVQPSTQLALHLGQGWCTYLGESEDITLGAEAVQSITVHVLHVLRRHVDERVVLSGRLQGNRSIHPHARG